MLRGRTCLFLLLFLIGNYAFAENPLLVTPLPFSPTSSFVLVFPKKEETSNQTVRRFPSKVKLESEKGNLYAITGVKLSPKLKFRVVVIGSNDEIWTSELMEVPEKIDSTPISSLVDEKLPVNVLDKHLTNELKNHLKALVEVTSSVIVNARHRGKNGNEVESDPEIEELQERLNELRAKRERLIAEAEPESALQEGYLYGEVP
jgi:hypothetical protein